MSIAEKGAVGDIDPAFFIGFIHGQKATGTLKFEEGAIQRAIYFREGRVLFSSSNAPEDQLGAILVAGGKISQEKFDSIVASLEPKQSIAAALSQGGHVSQRDIGDAARRKVEQIIGACCVQTAGQYEFEDGVLPKGALDLKLTTEKVLVAAFEVLEPSGFLIRILKSPVAVLARGQAEPTDPELARVRDALDGVSTIADIGGAVGLPQAATEARAAVLVVLGAASVVTSQIEEMSLPDTGEALPDFAAPGLDDSEPIEAETIMFAKAPVDSGTIAFRESPPEPASDPSNEATMMMAAPPEGLRGSPDDTLDHGTGSGMAGVISPPPRSPSAPKAQRASSQDLDAVQELLGSSAKPLPRPGSASIPSQRWEPVLSSQGRPGRERPAKTSVAKSVVAALLLAVVGVGGWFAYTTQNRPAPQPAPANPVATPSPAPTLAADADPATAIPAPPAAAVAPTPAAPTSRSASKAATPAPSVAATPVPKATEKPAMAPAPKTTPPPTTETAPAATAPASGTRPVRAGAGYEALKAGRLAEAAGDFEAVAQSHSADFSVQLLVACSPQTIEKAVQNDPSPELYILPAAIAGKPCHRLMRGFFKTNAEAAQAVSTLPGYYTAEGAKPRPIPVKSVLR